MVVIKININSKNDKFTLIKKCLIVNEAENTGNVHDTVRKKGVSVANKAMANNCKMI